MPPPPSFIPLAPPTAVVRKETGMSTPPTGVGVMDELEM